jgi:primosomal protein N' (replication factor Y)
VVRSHPPQPNLPRNHYEGAVNFQISLSQNNIFSLTYSSYLDLELGNIVLVPFRSKEVLGIVTEKNPDFSGNYVLKNVIKKLDLPPIKPETLTYYQKIADYNFSEIGSIIKIALPVDLHKMPKLRKTSLQDTIGDGSFNLKPLSTDQQIAYDQICATSKPALLRGVTGSGKTEIYFHLAARRIENGEQVLILIPEIALTTQIISRFKERFGFDPIVWNSSITESKKKNALHDIIYGNAKLIIGTRSALLLPYPNLKLIIVDEEHDSSYKQETSPIYNARDMAVLRGAFEKSKMLLCSATPAIETIYNVINGKYELVELKSRFGNATMPDINLIDMRKEKMDFDKYLSNKLISGIRQALASDNQVLLFLNRRGYAPLMLCKSCGHRYMCKSCSAWMTYHKDKKRLECHHCGAVSSIKPTCPDCKEENSHIPCGPGVERIYEEVAEIFPNKKIQLMTRENMQKPSEIEKLIQNIMNKEVDIIIGTQIITKGYHFPNLNFVGVIDADIGILGEDLKSPERAFQLLQQVSGRAGRGEKKGVVYIQTFMPDNLAIKSIANLDLEAFINYELEHRKEYRMPPFSRMALITISGKKEIETLRYAIELSKLAPKSEAIKILGPSAATMIKLQDKYRFRFILYAEKNFPIQQYIKEWFFGVKMVSKFFVKVDIDPYNMM